MKRYFKNILLYYIFLMPTGICLNYIFDKVTFKISMGNINI